MQLELLIIGLHLKMDLYWNCSLVKPVWWVMYRLKRHKKGQTQTCVTASTVTAALSEDRKPCLAGSWYLWSVSSVPVLANKKRKKTTQKNPRQEVGHRSTTNVSFVGKTMAKQSWFVPQDGGRVLSGSKVMKRPCQRWLKGTTYKTCYIMSSG